MNNESESALQSLLDKQAITENLLRFCRGCDRFDLNLLESVYWPEAIDDHGAYVGPASVFAKSVCDTKAIYNALSHKISPPLIELCGNQAKVETYFLCMVIHNSEYEMGEADYMIGGRYMDLCEKRGGEWKILRRMVIWDWNLKNAGFSDWGHMKVPSDGKYGAPMPFDPTYAIGDFE
jgi:hypothetical protein